MKLGLALVLVIGFTSASFAGTFGEPKIGQRYTNGATSLKVTEPENFKVTITTADGDKTGTVPEVFAMPEKDDFVKVTITAPDGTQWTKKVEIVAKKQTELAISFKADGPKAEPAKSRSFIGRMINQAGGCSASWKTAIRADFLDPASGTVRSSAEILHGKTRDLEVPSGVHEIRVFLLQPSKEWKFITTGKFDFNKDGWNLGFGCKAGTTTPIVIGAY